MLANDANLASQGIYIPKVSELGEYPSHHMLARMIVSRKPASAFKELAAELASAGKPEHILISSEAFQTRLDRPRYVKRLRDSFAALGYRLRIVAYIRPQVGYLNSSYSQDCKIFETRLAINDYVARALALTRYDYERLLLPATGVKDIEVIYRPFNSEVLEAGIATDFLSLLGLGEAAIAGLEIPPAKNVSPGPRTVAACLEISRRLSAGGIVLDQASRGRASRAIERLGDRLGWNQARFSGIGPALAEMIRERFAKGNDVFAARVWNRSWEDVYGAHSWTPAPLNAFERETASRRQASEFDKIVERTWRLIKDGNVDRLAAEAASPGQSTVYRRWLRRLRASFAG